MKKHVPLLSMLPDWHPILDQDENLQEEHKELMQI
jgi:hypothetical protein